MRFPECKAGQGFRPRLLSTSIGRAPSLSFFAAPGTPSSFRRSRLAQNENRGRAGRQRSDADPRASTPRDIEACRVLNAASPPNPGRPARGVLGLLREGPRGRPLYALARKPPLRNQALGPDTTDWHPTAGRQGPSAHRRSTGSSRLGRPSPGAASPTPRSQPRPPLPAPRLETLIRHPSVTGRDAM
jgi:hypothetical protein